MRFFIWHPTSGIRHLAAAILLLAATPLHSIESGSTFLRIDPTARPASMGGAFTAIGGDIDAVPYNPGGLSTMVKRQATFTHAEWLMGTNFDHLAYAQATDVGTFGVSALRLGYGDFEGRDASRLRTGTFDAYDAAYGLSYARRVGQRSNAGATFKLLQRKIASDDAVSYALDFGGVTKWPGRPVNLGAAVLNIGPGMRFIDQTDPLPLTFSLGAAYAPSSRSTIALDLRHEPNDDLTTAMAGVEFWPVNILALRAGYQLPLDSPADESAWDIDNLRGGVGLQIARFRLDYALVAVGGLGLTHRFTLAYRSDFLTTLLANEPK
jgi:hypothetical protein